MNTRMMFARAVAGVAMVCLGCVGMHDESDEPIESEFAAVREMVLETMHEKIGKLAENRTFYCRKEKWPGKLLSWEIKSLDWVRFGVINTDKGSPDDGLFGEELIDSLRKCTMSDEVSFGSISNRITRLAGLAWIGNDGSLLAGIVVITSDDVYFIYTEMNLFEGPGAYYDVYDILEEPPYYLWRNPYWTQRIWLTDQERLHACVKRIHSKAERIYPDAQLRDGFCFENIVTAFRIDIAPEKFHMADCEKQD